MMSLLDPFYFFRAPLAGDVMQRFAAAILSPSLTIDYAGDRTVETRVVAEVASFGKQLGWLSEIVLALASGAGPNPDTLRRLQDALAEIDRIKAQQAQSVRQRASDCLDRLREDDPAAYARLLRERSEQLPS